MTVEVRLQGHVVVMLVLSPHVTASLTCSMQLNGNIQTQIIDHPSNTITFFI